MEKTTLSNRDGDHTVYWEFGEPYVAVPAALLVNIVNVFSCVSGARTQGEYASALVDLSNEMSQLASRHPKYDYETGEVDWREIERDECEDAV